MLKNRSPHDHLVPYQFISLIIQELVFFEVHDMWTMPRSSVICNLDLLLFTVNSTKLYRFIPDWMYYCVAYTVTSVFTIWTLECLHFYWKQQISAPSLTPSTFLFCTWEVGSTTSGTEAKVPNVDLTQMDMNCLASPWGSSKFILWNNSPTSCFLSSRAILSHSHCANLRYNEPKLASSHVSLVLLIHLLWMRL